MVEAVEQFKTYRLAKLQETIYRLLNAVQLAYERASCDSDSFLTKKVKILNEFDKTYRLSVNRFKMRLTDNLDNNERTTKEIAENLKRQLIDLRMLSTELPTVTSTMFNFETMHKVMDMERQIKRHEKHFKDLESKSMLISSELYIQFDMSNGTNSEKSDRRVVQINTLQPELIRAQDPQDIMNFHLEKLSTFTLPKDKKEIQIRGCAIMDDNTVCLADRGNNRLICMTIKGYIKDIQLPSAPVDISCIKGTKIAVTLYDSKSIKMFDTEKWEWEEFLYYDRRGLTGITFWDDLIIVRTGGTGYCILNLKGKKVGTIPKPDSNMPYVACAKEKIFSAKWDTNEVFCFDKSGNTLWKFKDESIIKPANGVSADIDGNVYVTGSYSNSVAVISSDGKKCKQLINSSTNLDNPIAIDYHKTNNTLLVSAASGHAVLYSVIRN
ncbi:uncharacterized protein [Mytilus edulis]|uniref:uncharacterized protein n=1 Tax=Mytilus edulis TaxID=6550 RepID=UPI0039EF9CB8